MEGYNNSERNLKELIKDELVFDKLQEALYYAIQSIDNGGNLIVFKQMDGKYICVKENNREIPFFLGYELVADFSAVLFLHEKHTDPVISLDEYNSIIKKDM